MKNNRNIKNTIRDLEDGLKVQDNIDRYKTYKRKDYPEEHFKRWYKMSEENEVLDILKQLVDRIKTLERHVYNEDNVLMKSGWVQTKSPSPSIDNDRTGMPKNIGDKFWGELHDIISKMEGRQWHDM